MKVFGRRNRNSVLTTPTHTTIEIDRAYCDAQNLMEKWFCTNPEILKKQWSTILKKHGIMQEPRYDSENKLIVGNNKFITYTPASQFLSGPDCPYISIYNDNRVWAYAINNVLLPIYSKVSAGNQELIINYTDGEHYLWPTIELKDGPFYLRVILLDENTMFEPSPEMEEKFFGLELTENLLISDVFKTLRKYVGSSFKIELCRKESIFVYTIWRIKVHNGNCIALMEAHLSEDKSSYESIVKVDLENNSFIYEEEKNNLEYSFKKGAFEFKINSESFEESFSFCKATIDAFKQKMKNILN